MKKTFRLIEAEVDHPLSTAITEGMNLNALEPVTLAEYDTEEAAAEALEGKRNTVRRIAQYTGPDRLIVTEYYIEKTYGDQLSYITKPFEKRQILRKYTDDDLSSMIQGGQCRGSVKACDYILIKEGEAEIYAEIEIPEEADESEADWNDERERELLERVRE